MQTPRCERGAAEEKQCDQECTVSTPQSLPDQAGHAARLRVEHGDLLRQLPRRTRGSPITRSGMRCRPSPSRSRHSRYSQDHRCQHRRAPHRRKHREGCKGRCPRRSRHWTPLREVATYAANCSRALRGSSAQPRKPPS